MHPTNIAASRIVTTIAIEVTYSNPYKTGDSELIVAITEQGHTGMVMDAAREAGATGDAYDEKDRRVADSMRRADNRTCGDNDSCPCKGQEALSGYCTVCDPK